MLMVKDQIVIIKINILSSQDNGHKLKIQIIKNKYGL